jgi:Ca2+-dependent lipid-binding protein
MPKIKSSNNFLNDLMCSLTNTPNLFKAIVCRELDWSVTTFRTRQHVKKNTDHYSLYSLRETEIILRAYRDEVIPLLFDHCLSWEKNIYED